MPHNTNNTQNPTPPEDDSALWQNEAGLPSYEEKSHLPITTEYEALMIVIDPSHRISNHQRGPEPATLFNIRTHTRRLTQQLDDQILRRESRSRSNLSEGPASSNAEAANETARNDEADDIEASERDKLVALARVIHNMLNNL